MTTIPINSWHLKATWTASEHEKSPLSRLRLGEENFRCLF